MKEAVMEMKNYKEKMEEKKTHKSNGLPQRLWFGNADCQSIVVYFTSSHTNAHAP